MSQTIGTEAGAVAIEATPAGVIVNGQRIPAHEAVALAAALRQAAEASLDASAKLVCPF